MFSSDSTMLHRAFLFVIVPAVTLLTHDGVRAQFVDLDAAPAGPDTGVIHQPGDGQRITETDADVSPADRWQLTLYWENDGTVLKPNDNTDRYYTNGGGFSFAMHNDLSRDLHALVPFRDDFSPQRTAVGVVGGQIIFTPEDIERADLIEDDRPYAGYLFGAVFFQRSNEHTQDHFQLELGIVGPSSQADGIQKTIHDFFDEPEPRGWDNQLGDEVTIQAYLRKTWRLPLGQFDVNDIDGPVAVQLLPQVGVAVGTVHRHFEASLTLRMGVNLPDDFGPGTLRRVADFSGAGPPRGWSCYVFARALGRAVEHNLFLEGNTFRSSHGVDSEPLVGEATAGIYCAHRWDAGQLAVTYSQTIISERFGNQRGTHGFGALSVSMGFWF